MNSTEEQLLCELNNDKIRAYSSAIAFSAIVVIFGVLGNALAVTFYGFKVPRTSNNILITLLAAVDLITCIVISDKIVELCFTVTFKSVWGCKAIYFCNHTLVSVSGFTLLLVTVDRFRKICRPCAWQLSIFAIKVSFASIVVFSILFSVRDLVILDVVRVNVTYAGRNIRAYYCTHSRDKSLEDTVIAFQYIDLSFLTVVVVAIAVMYFSIAKKLWKSNRLTRRPPESQNIERKLTLMMFTITVGHLLSFIPYFIANLWIKQQGNSSAQEFNAGIQIALRSYMLNNAINPYIFGFFNPNFRKFVYLLLCDWKIFLRP